MLILKGQPIVARLAFGQVRVVSNRRSRAEQKRIGLFEPEEQKERLKQAISRMRRWLKRMFSLASDKLGEGEAQIFQVHEEMLDDPLFLEEIEKRIENDRVSAEVAIQETVDLFRDRYAQSSEGKIRFMSSELAGLGEDLLDELDGATDVVPEGDEPSIAFVNEVTPRMVMRAEVQNLAGFVARSGGEAAHGTILARALDIPMVVNLSKWPDPLQNGDSVILDGTAGTVIINPTEEKEKTYRHLAENLHQARLALLDNRDRPSVTTDGTSIALMANITLAAEAEAVERFGAAGVGLYRSELSYMLRNYYPSEGELTRIYQTLADRLAPKELTFRTLDIGGDKTPLYFNLPPSRNPLLGMRSMRLLQTHPEILRTQFRAILRASGKTGNFRILFPLIASLEEWREVKEAFEREKAHLKAEGVPVQEDLPLGPMIELPSAALGARALLEEADFASIGSNDLTQYTLGVDRSVGEVAPMYQPISPTVLHLIHRVVEAGRETNKDISLCGETAGDSRFTALLLGLGLRTLSMSPESIPVVKDRVGELSLPDCEALAVAALKETTNAGILRVAGLPDGGEEPEERTGT